MNNLKYNLTFALTLILIQIAILSCKSNRSGVSEKTGVSYNDAYNGGLQINKHTKQTPGPGLIAIEGGTFVMGGSLDQDINFDNNN